MCARRAFAAANIRLACTLLRDEATPATRAALAIALGDLALRHPNVAEPYLPHLFARLRDDEPAVRRAALAVATHLALVSPRGPSPHGEALNSGGPTHMLGTSHR